ncbi:MAG: tetratricopeptide repeat protein [Planctomycetes bacterium]|nr:tetratricopeptide repeat protein [Planctomycetota bacterium]
MAEVDKLFGKAEEAINKKNYGYAIDLLQQVLSIEPDNIKAHQTLFGVCMRQAKEKGAPSPALAYLKGAGPLFKMGLAFGNHEKKMTAAYKFLVIAPDNLPVRVTLAEALRDSGHLDGAVCEAEMVYGSRKDNAKVVRLLGQLYREKGDTKKAIEMYNTLNKLLPEDRESSHALKDLLADNTMKDGWSDASGSRDMMRDKGKAAELAADGKIHKTTEEIDQEIEAIQKTIDAAPDDPASVKHYLKLGETYTRKGDLESALATFEKAAQLDKVNPVLRMKVGDITVKQYQARIAEFQPAAKAGDAEAKEQVKALKAELLQFQVTEFTRRVKEHPTDMALKFALGGYLFEARNYDGAMDQFQMTIKDPKKKLDSHEYLGRCFDAKKKYDMAAGQFHKAIEANNSAEREKPLRYFLGLTLEKSGKKAEALEQYNLIYEMDIKFRDVAKRIEDLSGSTE